MQVCILSQTIQITFQEIKRFFRSNKIFQDNPFYNWKIVDGMTSGHRKENITQWRINKKNKIKKNNYTIFSIENFT